MSWWKYWIDQVSDVLNRHDVLNRCDVLNRHNRPPPREDGMKPWNFNQPVTIYHPNIQEQELADMDVDTFIDECLQTGAQAVVVSSGGIYAFYHTNVADHHRSYVVDKTDLIREITQKAHAAGLYVIARLDFSKVRMGVGDRHPDWLHIRQDGQRIESSRKYYATCPLSPYQNEAFAKPVMEELLRDYDVDGFHLNAEGFNGYCFCENCRRESGLNLDGITPDDRHAWQAFEQWRGQAFAEQMERYYDWMRAIKPNCFFMAELAGLEYMDWMKDKAFQFSRLEGVFSHILMASGGIKGARSSRYWAAMSADLAKCAGRPLINLKMQMRDIKYGKALVPPKEILMSCYQAIARGAGLKVVHFDLPHNVPDRRWRGIMREVFRFADRQRDAMENYKIHAPMKLVWPEAWMAGLPMDSVGKLVEAFSGLYTALAQRHVPFDVALDTDNLFSAATKPAAVLSPVLDGLSDSMAEAMIRYLENGGLLMLVDLPVPALHSQSLQAAAIHSPSLFPSPAMEQLLGGFLPNDFRKLVYILPDESLSDEDALCGPLPVFYPCRNLSALPGEGLAWSAYAIEEDSPEDFRLLEKGSEKLILHRKVGKGHLILCSIPLGNMMHEIGHGDFSVLIERILGFAGVAPYETNAPGTVMITLAESTRGLVLSLLQTAGTAPMNDIVASAPIRCALSCANANSVEFCEPGAEPQPLTYTLEQGKVVFTIPMLRLFGQVVIQ